MLTSSRQKYQATFVFYFRDVPVQQSVGSKYFQ